jgi:photosystem II stability/assembly factor-like uncharacterized protein
MPKVITIIIFLLSLYSHSFGQNFWNRIQSPTNNFLRTLHFADSLRGWVGGDSGSIFYTSDGGLNWSQQQTNTTNKIMKLFFLDDNRAWALAWADAGAGENLFYGTEILTTTNGGENWNVEQYREENVFLNGIYFLDSLRGFAGGNPGKFLITTDAGINWRNANIDSGAFSGLPPMHFNFYNELYGFAAGGFQDIAGVVWKTTNGGDSWKPINVNSPDPIRAIHFFDSLNVLGIGGDPEFFGIAKIRSTDAGESWIYEEPGIVGVATALSFRTECEGWAPTSFAQTFIYSFDSGNTWEDTSTVDSSSIYDLVFTDSLTGYAVGEEGVIVKYKYQYPDFVNDYPLTVASDFVLHQNFPNPFNPSTTVSYYLAEPGRVTINIYNLLGTHIATLIENHQSSGNHSLVWNAEHEPSGVYYLQLNVNGKQATRKMVLIK